jgi:drug/metabolite transporter (DMT)-like permease
MNIAWYWSYDIPVIPRKIATGGIPMEKDRKRKAIGNLQIISAFILAGSSVMAGKFLVASVPPFTVSLLALSCGLVFLLPSFFRRIPRIRGVRTGDILLVCVQGLFGMALFRVLMLKGLSSTSAAHAGVISSLGPALMGVAAVLILRERPRSFLWLGLVLGTVGIVLLRLPGAESGASSLGGDALIFAAVCCEAAMSVIRKKCGDPLDPLATASIIVIASVIFTLPLAVREWTMKGFPRLGLRECMAILYYGACATALAYYFWAAGSAKVDGARIALAMVAMPLSSVILSIAFLGERPGVPVFAGLALGVAGMLVGRVGGNAGASRACGENAEGGIMRNDR